jgi:2-iminobutanoate/2-iminopropanoate deaminase
MTILFSNPPEVASPDGQFSQCVVVPAGTSLLFVAGQVPRNANGDTVGVGNIDVQAHQVFDNLQRILKAHGSDFSKVIKATLFITDMRLAENVARVRSKFYGAAAPASTFVGVSSLGDSDWMLEVELVAAI